MKHPRLRSSTGSSLPPFAAAFFGGSALLWLAPIACSLSTEGNQFGRGSTESTSSSSSSSATSSSSSSGAGGGSAVSSSSSGAGGAIGTGGAGGAGGAVGTGGAGGTTGVGGAGGAGGGPVTYEWTVGAPMVNAGQPCYQSYTYTIPPWLTFSSPTASERTIQYAPDKLCRGYTADVPRARNVGYGWGLNVESQRKNLILNSDSWDGSLNGWNAGSMSPTPGQADPAGGVAATLFTSNAASNSAYASKTTGQVASSWLRGNVGGPPYMHFRHYIDQMYKGLWVDVDVATWKRYSVAQPASIGGEMALETRDIPTGAGALGNQRSVFAFGAQLEDGAHYPSSYIPTTNAAVTRTEETLASAPSMMKLLTPNGFYNITLKFAPNFAMNAMVNEMSVAEYNLIHFEGKNRLFLRQSDRKLVLKMTNTAETDPVEFDREQELTVVITSVNGGDFTVTLSGATAGNGTRSGSGATPVNIADSKVIGILGKDTGAEECADLRYIKFAPP